MHAPLRDIRLAHAFPSAHVRRSTTEQGMLAKARRRKSRSGSGGGDWNFYDSEGTAEEDNPPGKLTDSKKTRRRQSGICTLL
eukprot:m.157102 g.157102  ORF g.157102 m.157102 type:complete len:82 (+) comp38701_c0_seq7:2397-2642(+)